MRSNYRDSFKYLFLDKYEYRGRFEQGNILDFCQFYFTKRGESMDVYFNTISFIIDYILDEELERDFFIGVLRSILSASEKAFIFYYAISDVNESFKKNIIQSKLIQEDIKGKLIDEQHFQLL